MKAPRSGTTLLEERARGGDHLLLGDIPAPDEETVRAVIVTYHPDAGFAERAEAAARLTNQLVIVDNGSDARAIEQLRQVGRRTGAHLILNSRNRGLAAALNQGCRWVAEQGAAWALLFDQDTAPHPGLLSALRGVYQNIEDPGKVAVVGSNYHEPSLGRTKFEMPSGPQPYAEAKTVITSGSLVSLSAMQTVGPFREEFFIDHVDDDFCLRARSLGFRVLITREPLVTHAVGAPSLHRMPWRRYGTSNHSAVRRYYMTRNHVRLVREYVRRDPAWVIETATVRIKALLLLIAFEQDRGTKLRHAALGLWHGLLGRSGKL